MTTPLQKRLAEIRGRCERASPAPWATDGVEIFRPHTTPLICGEVIRHVELPNRHKENLVFGANARQDIPFLLDEIETLKFILERIATAPTKDTILCVDQTNGWTRWAQRIAKESIGL